MSVPDEFDGIELQTMEFETATIIVVDEEIEGSDDERFGGLDNSVKERVGGLSPIELVMLNGARILPDLVGQNIADILESLSRKVGIPMVEGEDFEAWLISLNEALIKLSAPTSSESELPDQ